MDADAPGWRWARDLRARMKKPENPPEEELVSVLHPSTFILPSIYTPYAQQLDPDWEGVTSPLDAASMRDYGCAYCEGGPGGHANNCPCLSKNYRVTSLDVQRARTAQLKAETDKGPRVKGDYGYLPSLRAVPPSESPDTRTEVQKRFDALAEELDNEKGAPPREE